MMDDPQDYRVARPATVTAAGALTLIPAALGLAFSLFSLVAMLFAFTGRGFGSLLFIPILLIGVVMNLIIPGLLAMLGIGIIRIRPWARTTGIVVNSILIVLTLGSVIATRRGGWQSLLVVFPIAVIALLASSSAREAFAEAREQQNL